MKEIVHQILDVYFKKMRQPTLEELTVSNDLLEKKGCLFVTLYVNGEVRWSAWNIKEISPNLWVELIENTMQALTWDKRFAPLTLEEAEKIQFRIDVITDRKMISFKDISWLDPVKQWVICIKRDYKKLASILPNMSPKLLTGDDFIEVLKNKLDDKKIDDKNHIFYEFSTQVETNY